ncbi:Hypothetical_protein [Hexamita inflata]|uniref:Hypothetical_protein n=1 Tax=Hexamita inflata TaxID=28002 RepID=A0AA86Q4I5_9EUKA|nr:Hypothetical protein HINF_LOCUS39829 [Hexamita inflata]
MQKVAPIFLDEQKQRKRCLLFFDGKKLKRAYLVGQIIEKQIVQFLITNNQEPIKLLFQKYNQTINEKQIVFQQVKILKQKAILQQSTNEDGLAALHQFDHLSYYTKALLQRNNV